MAEVPDSAIDELFQYRRKIFRIILFCYRMIEHIKKPHKSEVVFIDFVIADTQYITPNDIFHERFSYSGAWVFTLSHLFHCNTGRKIFPTALF